jgi:hypothetical protein
MVSPAIVQPSLYKEQRLPKIGENVYLYRTATRRPAFKIRLPFENGTSSGKV